MSSLIVALLLIAVIFAVCWLLIFLDNKHKRNTTHKLLDNFSKLASAYNLNFSSQDRLRNCVVGLDGINRKFLILKQDEKGNNKQPLIIDLDEVKKCSFHKISKSINTGTFKNRKMEEYLEKMVLLFERDNTQPVEVIFYNHIDSNVYEIPGLEQKGKHWEAILTKMLKREVRKIA